jgi:anti-anti-sigma regulatory factor
MPAPAEAPAPAQAARRKYVTVADEAALRALAQALDRATLVGFDTETTGLEPMTARLGHVLRFR